MVPYFPGHRFDTQCWGNWSAHIFEHGLLQTYNGSGNNYFPLYQYVLWIYGMMCQSKASILEHVHALRWVTFAFDLGLLWVVYQWIKRRVAFVFIVAITLLNAAYYYNTLVWGQVDSILSFFVLGGFYLLWQKKEISASIMMGLAMSFKLQGIIFIPVFGLLLLLVIPVQGIFRRTALCLLVFSLTILIVSSPFLVDMNTRAEVIEGAANLVDYYPTITVGSSNFWSVIFGKAADELPDGEKVLQLISYKHLGLLMFFAASAFALWPLLKLVIRKFRSRSWQLPLPVLILSMALVSLSFFTFNTQMHERYIHPLMAILLIYLLLTRDWVPFVLFSFAYMMNMESIIKNWKWDNYEIFIFNRQLLGSIYVILWIYLVWRLRQSVRKHSAPDSGLVLCSEKQ